MRGRQAYRWIWLSISWIFLFVNIFAPIAPVAHGVEPASHPLNPSGEGEVVIPSPFDTRYPFPVYIPREIKAKLVNAVTAPAGKEQRQIRQEIDAMRDQVKHQLGVYPHVALSGDVIQQVAFMKPFSDSILFGDFFRGSKKRSLDRLQKLYAQVREAARNIFQEVKQQGRLPDRSKPKIKAYIQSVHDAHDIIQNFLNLPPENVDPDVVLDMANAMGVGPQVWYQQPSDEEIVKRTIERFCATTYLYRYVVGKKAEERQPLDLNVDQFSEPYYDWEATQDGLLGMTLEERKRAYAKAYQEVMQNQSRFKKVLSSEDLASIDGVSVTWARMPDWGETQSSMVLTNVFVPLVKGPDQRVAETKLHPSFARYLVHRAQTLMRPISNPPEEMMRLHKQVFLMSMGYPKSGSYKEEALALQLQEHPFKFLRIKDQFMVFRGLYEDKKFGLIDSESKIFSNQFKNNYGRFQPVAQDKQRNALEDVIPQMLCESLYQRNYVTQILLTQKDVNVTPLYGHVTDTARIARPWFEFWRSYELDGKGMDMVSGSAGLELRPWSLYLKLYFSDKKPRQNIQHPKFLDDRQFPVLPASLSDWILPRLFTRMGRSLDFTRALWSSGLGIFPTPQPEVDSLRPHFDQYVQRFKDRKDYERIKPYIVQNFVIGDTQALDTRVTTGAAEVRMDLVQRQRQNELWQLSQHIWRSRVLFTPQELHLILITYFKEFLLPLALLQKFMKEDVPDGGDVSKLKRFFMSAGTVQYELLYLLQNKSNLMFFDVKPGILTADNEIQVAWRSEDLVRLAQPTRAGYVISFSQMWQQETRSETVIPEWSKHDRLKTSADKIERVLNKRVVWCKTLPLSTFSELAKTIELPAESVRELVCAVPGYFHVARDFGVFMAKEHLRTEALKYYFDTLMKRKKENRALLPFLSQVPEVSTINTALKTDEKPEASTINLQKGINQYQELAEMIHSYKDMMGWFGLPNPEINKLFDTETFALNWKYSVPPTFHGVDVSSNNLDLDCNYLGTALNPFSHERELFELKMMCLFQHVKTVRDVLVTQPSPFRSVIQQGLLADIDYPVDSYLAKLAVRIQGIQGKFETKKAGDCSDVAFEMTQELLPKAAGQTLPDQVQNSVAHVVNQTASEKFGGYVRDVVRGACEAASEMSVSVAPEALFEKWKAVLKHVSDKTQFKQFFGEDVLFESVGEDRPFEELTQDLSRNMDAFLKVVEVAHARQSGQVRTDEETNLVAELGLAYREVQFENQLRSLVAIKTAMTDQTLKGQDPLADISSGMMHTSYAREINTVSEVGTVDYSFLPFVGFKFAYNREATTGKVLAVALDFLGMGQGGIEPGTTFVTEEDTGLLASFSKTTDQWLCAAAMNNGGRLMPWLSTDGAKSVVDALNPVSGDWHWRGWRMSLGIPGVSPHKVMTEPGYFCDLKYAVPNRKDFSALTAREQQLIDEANTFLAEIRDRKSDTKFQSRRDQARYEIEAEFVQAALVRVFIDKLTAQVLMPYRQALEGLQQLTDQLRGVVTDYGNSSELGAQVWSVLMSWEYKNTEPNTYFTSFAYLRQLWISMREDLFPQGVGVKNITVSHDQRQAFKKKLFVLFGSLGHIKESHPDIPVAKIQKEGARYSLISHVHSVISEIENFNAEVGGRIISRYPMLEWEFMRPQDGVDWGADVPKYYQVLFASSVFDGYRLGKRDANPVSKKSNAALANAMSVDFYDKSQDDIDTALQELVSGYPFSPSDVLTHRLGKDGKHLGEKEFKLFFLGDRTELPKYFSASGTRWVSSDQYEMDRQAILSMKVQAVFPWLKSYTHSLTEHLVELAGGASPDSVGQVQKPSLFSQYMQAEDAPLVVDFRQRSAPREQFSMLFDKLLVKQMGENQNLMQRTFRSLYEGEFVSGAGLKPDVLAQEKTLVQLFSMEGILDEIKGRFGDRFIELEHEFIPSRVYSYFEQEQAYMMIMAEFGNMLMAVVLATVVVAAVDAIFGSHGFVGGGLKAVTGATSRLATAARFALLFMRVSALSVMVVYPLFSALADAPFMPVLILVLLLSMLRISGGLVSVGPQRIMLRKVLGLLKTLAFDVFIGVIMMDVIGMVLDWQVSNYTSAAYAQYSVLFFSHMKMGRLYTALYGKVDSRDYQPLIRDYQYLNYLKQTKTLNFSFAILGTLLAGIVNTKIVVSKARAATQFDKLFERIAKALPATYDGDIFRYLREDPQGYVSFLIQNRDVIPQVVSYMSEHLMWKGRKLSQESITRLQKDLNTVRVQLADGSLVKLDVFAKLNPNLLDLVRLGDQSAPLNIRIFSELEIQSAIPISSRMRMSELLIRMVDDMVDKGRLRETDRVRLVQGWDEQDLKVLHGKMNEITAAALRNGGRIEDAILTRLSILDMTEHVSGRAYLDQEGVTQLFNGEDFRAIESYQQSLGDSGAALSVQMRELLSSEERMLQLRQRGAALGFDMQFSRVRGLRLGDQVIFDDGLSEMGPYVARSGRATPYSFDDMKFSPYFSGEKGAVDTRMKP